MVDAPPSSFEGFELDARLVQAVEKLGFSEPTPIQLRAIPPLLEGRDVIGRARTGSGKTAAFALPLLQQVVLRGGERRREKGAVRALVLVPTRELALQVSDAIRSYATDLGIVIATIYGGSSYGPQLKALGQGAPIVIGTPGRIIDHLDRGSLDLSGLEMLVLDEADEMLRMGFFEDVERIVADAPHDRQVALFSATMPPPIRRVASVYLHEPLEIQVESKALSTEHVKQKAIIVPQAYKLDALVRVLRYEPLDAAIIFARTRAGCAEAAAALTERGFAVEELHGDLSQSARELVIKRLRSGRLQLVVATDVAARGLDVERLSHVINLDLPTDAETYVHRIGRTGRAGRAGMAISLATPAERSKLRRFEQALKGRIDELLPPTDAQLAKQARSRLKEEIAAAEVSPGHELLADELLNEGEAPLVLAAALALLSSARGIDLDAVVSEGLPAWARQAQARSGKSRDGGVRDGVGGRGVGGRGVGGRGVGGRGARGQQPAFDPMQAPRPRGRGGDRDEIELFLATGRERGVRPQDIVGALANELDIAGSSIGRITITDRKSFVRLPREIAEAVLQDAPEIGIRGVNVALRRARPRLEPGGKPQPSHRPKRHGGLKQPQRRGKVKAAGRGATPRG